MNNEHEASQIPDAEDIDPGEPIAALAGFEHDVSSGLVTRILRTVQRRTTVGQLASFSVSIPLVVLREFWTILINRPKPIDRRKDANHGEKTS
jgi:hypothetical protein